MTKEQLISSLMIIAPELLLSLIAFATIILGVVCQKSSRSITYLSSFGMICLLYALQDKSAGFIGTAFNASFANTSFTILVKFIMLTWLLMIYVGSVRKKEFSIEFIMLSLLSTIGSFIAISAKDLMVLFVALELQALPSYIMAASVKDSIKSSEAGLKYFALGALSSAIMLFGISLIYGFTGGITYGAISGYILHTTNLGVIVGISMVLVGMLFKLSAAPFHMWTPDVYEGAPIQAAAVFASIQKLAIIVVLVGFLSVSMGKLTEYYVPLLKVAAIISLVIGALGGMLQTSIKRIMAYSAIFNAGFLLLAIITDLSVGMWRHAFFTYITIYGVSIIGLFMLLGSMFGSAAHDLTLKDLAGLSLKNKISSVAIVLIISSMIGIPPLAGFFAKYYVLYDLISMGEYELALAAILSSVIAAFYYLKIIKAVYFEEAVHPCAAVAPSKHTVIVVFSAVVFLLSFSERFAEYFSSMKLCI